MFAPDRSYLGELSAVGTNAVVCDFSSYFFFRYIIERIFNLSHDIAVGKTEFVKTRVIFRGEIFYALFFDLILSFLAFESVDSVQSPIELFGSVSADFFVKFGIDMIKVHFPLGFAADGSHLFDESALLFDFFVTEQNRADHLFVVDFFRARFNHHDSVLSAGKVKMKGGKFSFLSVRVDDILAVYHTDYDGTRRTGERNIGNGESDRRTEHCKRLGSNVRVDGKSGCNDGYVVKKPLREKRTNRSVDKTGSKDSFVACSAFSSLEATGDFPDGVHFFFVIDGKREKVHTLARGVGHGYVDHNDGVAAADEARAVSLLRVLAYIDGDFSAADFGFENLVIY